MIDEPEIGMRVRSRHTGRSGTITFKPAAHLGLSVLVAFDDDADDDDLETLVHLSTLDLESAVDQLARLTHGG